jgi:hypothetical protein
MTGLGARKKGRLIAAAASAVIAVIAVSLGVVPSGARAASGPSPWVVAFTGSRPGVTTGIAAINPRDAWATAMLENSAGAFIGPLYVLHWDGVGWLPVTVPGGADYLAYQVAASSGRDVWVFARDKSTLRPAIFRYDGTSWHKLVAPDAGTFRNPVVLSPTDAWVASGDSACTSVNGRPSCHTTVLHWNGVQWKPYVLDTIEAFLAGTSASNVWAVGIQPTKVPRPLAPGTIAAFRWNGTRWTSVSLPRRSGIQNAGIGIGANGDTWISATPAGQTGTYASFALHLSGHTWAPTPVFGSADAMSVVPDGQGGVWLGGLAHWTGTEWVKPGVLPASLLLLLDQVARIPGTPSSYWATARVSPSSYPTIVLNGPLP